MSDRIKRKANDDGDDDVNADKSNKKQKESEISAYLMTNASLITILSHLSQENLVKVADENDFLLPIARHVFKEKFIDPVQITNHHGTDGNSSIKLLNIFGNEIYHLKIIYKNKFRQFDHIIDQAVFDKCQKMLQNISFVNADRYSMFKIKKPFEKVTKVTFEHGDICIPGLDFGKWFPAARELELSNLLFGASQNDDDRLSLGKHCPNLEHLVINNLRSEDNNLDFMGAIGDLIALNTSLKSLTISHQKNLDYLLSIISSKASILPDLQLNILENPAFGVISSRFEKLKKVKIVNTHGSIDRLKMTINEVELMIFYGIKFTDQWFESIEGMTSVKTMVLYGDWQTGVKCKFLKKVKTLPKLKILLCPGIFSEDILEVTTQSKSLKILYVPGLEEVRPDMEAVRNTIEQCGHKWKLIHHGDNQPVILDGQDYNNVFEFEKE